jgi:hypothetical protein
MNASEWPPMQEGGGENLALMEKILCPAVVQDGQGYLITRK